MIDFGVVKPSKSEAALSYFGFWWHSLAPFFYLAVRLWLCHFLKLANALCLFARIPLLVITTFGKV
jgi:hypothetical protein